MILKGIRVLDFTQYLAGPTVTRLMAEMGADIIKIERAPLGDPARLLPAIKDGRSGYFVQQNLGKRSLCIDLNHGDADALIHELVEKVDVVVENFGPGVMQRRGWDFDALLKINPKLIMASVSAFGRTGPLAHKTGFDWIAQAFAGIMHMTGPADGPPHPVGVGMADISTGVHAFASIGYALFHRERTGEGQYMDISMIDSLFHLHEVNLQVNQLTDGNEAIEFQEKLPERDSVYFHNRHRLDELNANFFSKKRKRVFDESLQKAVDNLDLRIDARAGSITQAL